MVRGHAGLRARAHRLQGGPGHPADGPECAAARWTLRVGSCGRWRQRLPAAARKTAASTARGFTHRWRPCTWLLPTPPPRPPRQVPGTLSPPSAPAWRACRAPAPR